MNEWLAARNILAVSQTPHVPGYACYPGRHTPSYWGREAALIEELLEYAPKAHRLIGTTLAEYTALIEQAALVICND